MKTILVPCDFSKPSESAFRYAIDFAEQNHGVIHLVHVIELPVLHEAVAIPVMNYENAFMEELRKKGEDAFEKLSQKYSHENVKLIYRTLFGSPSQVLLKYIKDEDIEVVVMGSHGASGFREYFIGSNAEKMVRKSPVPVLICKNYTKQTIKNIVFPNTLDTEFQEELVLKIKALQDFFKAKLHIVYINTPINFTADHLTYERLNSFVKRFMITNYTLNVYNHQNEEVGILGFTQMVKGDLIAMGTHGRKGLARLLNGSLAEDITNHTDKLVWTYAFKSQEVEV